MKAAIYTSYGTPDVLNIEEIEAPTLKEEDEGIVLIKVHSASVNPFDVLFRKGYFPIRLSNGFLKPKQQILGIDVAGTVVAVSDGVDQFKVGDRVFGGCMGAHAEYVRARQTSLSLLPETINFSAAAAMPTAAQTALQALRDVADIKEGQKVLVYGASGGVGHFAVQLAKAYGAEVTAVCSTPNQGWVKDLGADRMVDYTQEDFAENGERYDLILDAVGKRTYYSCKPSLTENGVYITEHPLTPKYQKTQIILSKLTGDKRLKNHLTRTNQADLDLLRDLMVEGKLAPTIEKTYPLAEIVAAHGHVESGRTKGKVVIEVIK